MKTVIDSEFVAQRERYRFTFTCESCTYHVAEDDRCAHGYPDAMHRLAAFAPGAPIDGMFCKEFELL